MSNSPHCLVFHGEFENLGNRDRHLRVIMRPVFGGRVPFVRLAGHVSTPSSACVRPDILPQKNVKLNKHFRGRQAKNHLFTMKGYGRMILSSLWKMCRLMSQHINDSPALPFPLLRKSKVTGHVLSRYTFS